MGFRFFFNSNENNESIHVHIEKGDGNAKFWLMPPNEEEYSYGFKASERKEIRPLVNTNSKLIIDKWNEYFAKK